MENGWAVLERPTSLQEVWRSNSVSSSLLSPVSKFKHTASALRQKFEALISLRSSGLIRVHAAASSSSDQSRSGNGVHAEPAPVEIGAFFFFNSFRALGVRRRSDRDRELSSVKGTSASPHGRSTPRRMSTAVSSKTAAHGPRIHFAHWRQHGGIFLAVLDHAAATSTYSTVA